MTPAATAVPLHPLLAERWSPRGLDAGHALAEQDVAALLEAARWAPSASNTQPWRFVVASRGSRLHTALLDVLAGGNRGWAASASALVLVAARTQDDAGRPLPWALYDTGAAVAHLSVQAQADGLAVHQMGGFDAAAVTRLLELPDGVQPLVVLAVGRRDEQAELPEALAARERAPRERLPLDALLLPVPAALQDEDARAA